jgi:hypothetical protein
MKTGKGLNGMTGLYPGGHIPMRFSNNGMVFVDDGYHWKRVPEAEADPEKIIRCSHRGCNKPAITLDHYYPYYRDDNKCEDHGGLR